MEQKLVFDKNINTIPNVKKEKNRCQHARSRQIIRQGEHNYDAG